VKNIRILMKSLREFKLSSILAPVLVIGEVAMEVLIPFIMAMLIDQGITAGKLDVVVRDGILLLVLSVVSLAFGCISGQQAAVASTGFAQNLRKDMFYRVQTFSFSNIDRFSTSSIVTRLTTDVTNVQNAYQMSIRTLARCPVMLISALVLCFRINAHLSMIFVFVIPILFAALIFLILKVHPIFEIVFKIYDRLNEVVQENLYGIRVVKSFRREAHENEKFGKVSENLYKNFTKAEKTIAINFPVMMVAVFFCMIGIAWLGARIIVSSGGTELTTGELMSFFTYAMQILMSLIMISMVFVMLIMAQASGERIAEILTEESDIRNGEHPLMEVPDGSIDFNHVNFKYSEDAEKDVLTDIDFHIRSGETIGIIGGTGSAKSSLVQLIPRLYDVSEGNLEVGGHDVRDYDLETLRNQVAMVLQKNVLFSGTIKENLRWGKEDATDEELLHVCRLAQADDFIQGFPDKYDTYIEQGGTNVSGGQKQRLCIARALLKKPKILILDDSTSAVDTKTDAMIRQAFLEEIPETTKIIIAQRISSVQDADRILVMDSGRISAAGTHEELLNTSEIYREVYESQQNGGEEDA
jgi:ATP-binding cassette subfamily B multidrug efflux pump